jgi:hypothetical protein
MPLPELTELSLLILADLSGTGKRTQQRIRTLQLNAGDQAARPRGLQALEAHGLVTIHPVTGGGYKVSITDAGISRHTALMTTLRNA